MMAPSAEAGHIALRVGQAPDSDLERQIADMKRRWQELQQVLASVSPPSISLSPSSSSSLATSSPTAAVNIAGSIQQHQQSSSTSRLRPPRLSPSSSRRDSTPHLVEGEDQDHENDLDDDGQQERDGADSQNEEEDEEEEGLEEDEGDDEGDLDTDCGSKRKHPSKKNNNSKRRRLTYSYNVDDRKAWRKRQVGVDGLTDEERWEKRMSELQAFKQRFGHVNVPQKWHENQKLANWLKNVRQRWTHVPHYLTPDKEEILNELGVKKCEPLDVIIAKAKGRSGGGPGSGSGGKRKRSAASSSDDPSASASSDDGTAAPAPNSERRKRRRASAPEQREMPGATEAVARGGMVMKEEPSSSGPRRSGRKRKPLFDLETLELVQQEQLQRAVSQSDKFRPLPPPGV